MTNRRLDGRVAVITGGARGLGQAFAGRLAGIGAAVAIVDIDLGPDLKATLETARAEGREVDVWEGDAGEVGVMDAVIAEVLDRWGRVDIAICNAGGGSGRVTENQPSKIDPAQLDVVLKRNLHSTVLTCGAVSDSMREQRYGKIVTLGSSAGLIPNDEGGYAHYSVSKAAVMMYTRCLAEELGPYGITVNSLAPGPTKTQRLHATLTEAQKAHMAAETPLQRLGEIEDAVSVVEFLVTDASRHVTGCVIPCDGGLVRGPV